MNSEKIDSILEEVKQTSDELQVKAKLGALELQEELAELESSYELLKSKIKKISEVAGDSADEIKTAVELGFEAKEQEYVDTAITLALDELKEGYNKIKKLI